MSPAVFYNFEEVIKAYISHNFDKQRFEIVTIYGTPWMHLSIHEALNETFHIVEKETNLYLHADDYHDILKGKKVKVLNQRKNVFDEWQGSNY